MKAWIHGLSAAAIGGSATAIASALATGGHVDFQALGKVALVGAVLTAAGYLKQSPLPK